MIKVPQQFIDFVEGFYEPIPGPPLDFDLWVKQRASFMQPAEIRAVRQALDQMLSGKYSDQELQQAWMIGTPLYGAAAGQYRLFLTMIRKALGT